MTDGLPSWHCHRVVKAAKVLEVMRVPGEPYVFALEGGLTVKVDEHWVQLHCMRNPEGEDYNWPSAEGGYYLEYEDGYSGWSSSLYFEKWYTRET